MQLETERLCIVPLMAHQLWDWTESSPALAEELNCVFPDEPMDEEFQQFVRGRIETVANAGRHYLLSTIWLIIRKTDRIVVGSIGFKGEPYDDNDEVEIGYALDPEFERNGYMTESVKAMCHWALDQRGIAHITAETYPENLASQNVLKRCGFVLTDESFTFAWRL